MNYKTWNLNNFINIFHFIKRILGLDFAFDQLSIADINAILIDSSFDISGCLVNCSNNGQCAYQSNNKITCTCMPGFTGKACEIDLRVCSPKNNKCMNNGLCIEVNNKNGFVCNCSQFYVGDYCETKIDLCKNITCSSHGTCVDLGNSTKCVCYEMYLGDLCQNESDELAKVKAIISIASIIAIITIVLFYNCFLLMDFLKYICKNRQGKNSKPKNSRIRFKYSYIA